MGLSWIDDLIDYTPLFALRMRPCCIRFTLGHGAELEKGTGAIPYQVDLGWYLDVMTLLSGRTLGEYSVFRSSWIWLVLALDSSVFSSRILRCLPPSRRGVYRNNNWQRPASGQQGEFERACIY